MADCVSVLKEWTGKARTTIVYDSTVDEFTAAGLFKTVRGKPNIATIGFTTDGDVFGGFYNVAVTGHWGGGVNDPELFLFSFESHGRCETPQRFDVYERKKRRMLAVVHFYENNCYGFVSFWVCRDGGFFLGNERSYSYSDRMSRGFRNLQNTTLTGKNRTFDKGPFHHCTRLIAVQLE